MEDKDTQNFERESFKEKILRQLAAGNQSLDDIEPETVFSDVKQDSNSDVNLFADRAKLGEKITEDVVYNSHAISSTEIGDTALEEVLTLLILNMNRHMSQMCTIVEYLMR